MEWFESFLAPSGEVGLHFAGLRRRLPAQCNSASWLVWEITSFRDVPAACADEALKLGDLTDRHIT
jgi:hypothetical protein